MQVWEEDRLWLQRRRWKAEELYDKRIREREDSGEMVGEEDEKAQRKTKTEERQTTSKLGCSSQLKWDQPTEGVEKKEVRD